jgi:hypothetical protein
MTYSVLAKFSSVSFLTKALPLGVLINNILNWEFHANNLGTTKVQKKNIATQIVFAKATHKFILES